MSIPLDKYREGIESNLAKELTERVIRHKEKFVEIMTNKYRELLPNLITYTNKDTVSIDFLKLEVALANGYQVVIGENKLGNLNILGYVNTVKSKENPSDILTTTKIKKEDITFTIGKKLIPDEMEEISREDGCQTGNFVVIRDKTLNYVHDMEIVHYYIREMAELVLSRYSISMQAKINTFFVGDVGDEMIPQLVAALYNGAPAVQVSSLFDVAENIVTLKNEFMASMFVEIKREYQNRISELNNMLGINSLAVDKSSGVSDTEAKSNRSFVTATANIKLDSRNHSFQKINKRFKTDIVAVYDDIVASEFSKMAYTEDEENEGQLGSNNKISE